MPGVTPVVAGFKSDFRPFIALGDVVAVNGRPAKGVNIIRGTTTTLRPSPTPGQVISDVNRNHVLDWHLEIQQADGTPVGTIMGKGFGAGSAIPGTPPGAANVAVVGGTGAFAAVRGQMANVGSSNLRTASMLDDPADRRTNGGGTIRMGLYLIPVTWLEVTGLFHGEDFSPVTPEKPARAGELLMMSAANLGPTRPGMSNVYRGDFRVPEGTAAGTASLGLSVAWINGPEVKIPVK